jgi:hypothetical protein
MNRKDGQAQGSELSAGLGRWVPVSEKLPPPGVPVLAFVQNHGHGKFTRRIRAQYAASKTLEAFDDEEGEYDEKRDAYFVKPGWYETNEYEETHWAVSDPVTHWMKLPDPPAA